MKYSEAYARVKKEKKNLPKLIEESRVNPEAFVPRLRQMMEMILVREYADWHIGNPEPNISKSIHIFCEKIADRDRKPPVVMCLAAMLLAWSYVCLNERTDDAYLLLEHIITYFDASPKYKEAQDIPWSKFNLAVESWRQERGVPGQIIGLPAVERDIWNEILRWEINELRAEKFSKNPIDTIRKKVPIKAPKLSWRPINEGVRDALDAIQNTAALLVWDQPLFKQVQKRGYAVRSIDDLKNVPLEVLDEISRNSMKFGKTLAAIEGGGAGIGGFFLAAVDIPAILTLNIRYISQLAHIYGYETTSLVEQAFIFNILGVAAATDKLKAVLFEQLNSMTFQMATNGSLKRFNRRMLAALISRVVELIGLRLAEKKIAQILPLASGAIGSIINYTYTRNNLVTARMMYRKRRLIERCVH